MVELVDTRDLKSLGPKTVRVRFPLAAPFFYGHSEMKCSECPFLLQNADNCIGRIDFGILVQVCVNIGGCSDGTVTKPRLNFLHGDTLGKQKRCTATASYFGRIFFFQKLCYDTIKL